MATSITPTAPTTTPSPDAPTTLAAVAPTLAEQLYTTAPVAPTGVVGTPEAAALDPAPTDAAPAGDEVATDAPEYVQDGDGKWHRADGTFATADELAQIEAQLAETEQAKADEEANKSATIAKLRDRNGNLIEVETGDEQLAQLINQNTNDGMRRREFLEAQSAIEARASIIERAEQVIAHNPEGFVQANMDDEQQVRLATMLLARHFDALIPIIQQYDTDASSRIAATAQAQLRIKQQTDEFQTHHAAQQAAASVRQAIAAMIPETADQATADEFWQVARMLCTDAVNNGQPVTPETAPQILASTLKRYGFQSAAPAAPQRPRITLAKSASATPAAPAAGTTDAAKANQQQQRLRLVQQRRNAAAIPPHGRGGPAKPAHTPADRAFQDAAHLLYGNTQRA